MQCLGCETVTRNEVVFYHLSLAIAQHSSLTHCLRQFRWVWGLGSAWAAKITTCPRL